MKVAGKKASNMAKALSHGQTVPNSKATSKMTISTARVSTAGLMASTTKVSKPII